jgi:hypothetical protein
MILEKEEGYGCVVIINQLDADEFEDFLTEKRYVLFNLKIMGDNVKFFFGEASCLDSVSLLIDDFNEQKSNENRQSS